MVSESIEQHIWQTKFPNECKQLPTDYLTEYERNLAEKCVKHEKLTEEEKTEIKKLLNDYRPFFKEYNAEYVEKNIEKANNIVRTQSQLLELIHDENRYRIDMNYYINGEKYLLQMKIKPYTDKQYIEGLGTQMGLFRDLNEHEKKIMAKGELKQKMSPEEMKMYKAVNDKITEKLNSAEFNVKLLNEFLADRLCFVDDENTTFEENVAFWKQIDLNEKTALFHEVRGRLHMADTFEEDLFPPVR